MIEVPEFSENQIMVLLRYLLEKRAREENKTTGEPHE